jgi:hypothetical protein
MLLLGFPEGPAIIVIETGFVMRVLDYLVEMFIQAFGITRPTQTQQRRVSLLLGGVLLAALLLFVIVGVGMILYLKGGR